MPSVCILRSLRSAHPSHGCAVLAVTVKSADIASVKSIKVSSSDCALSGAFTVSDEQTAVLTDATNVANTVTLNCGTTAVTTTSEGTVFYIAILS